MLYVLCRFGRYTPASALVIRETISWCQCSNVPYLLCALCSVLQPDRVLAEVLHLTCQMESTKDSNSTVPAVGDAGVIEERRKPGRCEEMLQFSLDRCERP